MRTIILVSCLLLIILVTFQTIEGRYFANDLDDDQLDFALRGIFSKLLGKLKKSPTCAQICDGISNVAAAQNCLKICRNQKKSISQRR
jgi:hypothetical protein